MNAHNSKAEIFDVFLCHNSEDKPQVREIAQKLIREGMKPWLDEREIRPGTSWQTALEQQIGFIKSAAVFVGDSGIGPWQLPEIQAFLNQFVKRECPVIPVVLDSVKTTPKLPLMLENLEWVDFRVTDSYPLQRLIWGITGEKPAELAQVPSSQKPTTAQEATKPRLVPGRDERTAAYKMPVSKERFYPPLAEPPDQGQAIQLKILRGRVMEYWVDGVLKHSLYNEVLISLGMQQMDRAVNAPWKYTVEVSDAVNSENRDISAIYDTTGLLLILGEPGSGKTTTLLDLARTLLDRSRDDIKERVPVVVNLSTWKNRQPLVEWISGELSEQYRVPRKIARFWLQQNYLLPLLDGLDEVETSTQPDCLTAINAFIEEFNPSGLVVCCRLSEYCWLPERLKLNGAICLEPLSSEEVSEYLDRGGPKLAGLREAVNSDPALQELAQTPLMLSIMSLAFQGADGNELATQKGDSEERRKQIFRLYVEQMFQRKETPSLAFPKEKTVGWLSWLAQKMRERSQSVFLVEGLRPSWLSTRAQRVAYGTVVALSLGLIFGLMLGLLDGLNEGLLDGLHYGLIYGLSILAAVGLGCWLESPLKSGVMSGSIGGLVYMLLIGLQKELVGGALVGLLCGLGAGSLNHITLVETMSWKWNQFWKGTIPGSLVGLLVGLLYGLIYGLFTYHERLIYRLFFGLPVGLTGGLLSGLARGFTDTVKAGKVSPNQGIKLSRKNALVASLIVFLTVGLLPVGLFIRLAGGQRAVLLFGLLVGLIFGLSGGLNRGGSAVIKHYALRLILWRKDHTPLNFIKFLDQCARLILLKKVGGGYIFIHRMLLDYFAEMTPQSIRTEDGKAESVGR